MQQERKSPKFSVLPAVDLLGNEAVRLVQGSFDAVVLREADPYSLLQRYVEAGSELVHVVDLTAARSGCIRPEVIACAAEAVGNAALQAAGGVRSVEDAVALAQAGAVRVVVGTSAFTGPPDLLPALVAELGERVVVAIDVRDGVVATEGWTRATSLSVADAVIRCVAAGITRLMCTAIERDGTLTGPSLELLARVVEESRLPVLAAGGIRSPADIEAVEAVGCEGAIVGRALLEGLVPLSALGARR